MFFVNLGGTGGSSFRELAFTGTGNLDRGLSGRLVSQSCLLPRPNLASPSLPNWIWGTFRASGVTHKVPMSVGGHGE